MGILSKVFSDRDWRDDLDAQLVQKLEKLLKRTNTYEDAYRKADNPAMAQMWVAMAEVFSQLERTNARIRKLEERQKQIVEGVEQAGIEDIELKGSLERY